MPLCADEPANTSEDLPRLVDRYNFAHTARAAGLRLMVGCMIGGSVAMAPAMVLARLCEIADLDGPLLQAEDWPNGIVYRDGVMSPPSPALWG